MKNDSYKKEILGIVLSAIAIFIFLALITYTPGDPSPFTTRTIEQYKNLVGKWGAFTAAFLYFVFGVAIYPLFFMCILWVINLFHKGSIKHLVRKSVGYVFFAIFLDLFFHIINYPIILAYPGEKDSLSMTSGLLGWGANHISTLKFGSIGLYLIVIVSLALTLILSFNVSVAGLLNRAVRFASEKSKRLYVKISAAIKKHEKSFTPPAQAQKEKKTVASVPSAPASQAPPSYEKAHNDEPIENISAPRANEETKTIEIETQLPETLAKEKVDKSAEKSVRTTAKKQRYKIPPISLLNNPEKLEITDELLKQVEENKRIIEETLAQFNAPATVVGKPLVGPTISTYELSLGPGVRVNSIMALEDNLSLALRNKVRVIYRRATLGIEIPNEISRFVVVKEIIQDKNFYSDKISIPIALGMNMKGEAVIADLAKMPHVLIAGATGSGKSVCVNSFIVSVLYKFSPEELRLILIDPKMVELMQYKGLPHIIDDVLIEPKPAANALVWAVEEMEQRFRTLAKTAVRDIQGYHRKCEENEELPKMPFIVIIIDELADLMMVAGKDIETNIARLAQKARAVGIHLVVATQRPSADVITGLIKANFPTRIAFQVSSKIDSRVILDTSGAEQLVGRGDMLYLPGDPSNMVRMQGAFLSENEIKEISHNIKMQDIPTESISLGVSTSPAASGEVFNSSLYDYDPLFKEAATLVLQTGTASVSFLQRKLSIGYQRAARIMDEMLEAGVIGPPMGNQPREILVDESFLNSLS